MIVNDFSIDQKKASNDINNLFIRSGKTLFDKKKASEIQKIKYTFQK